MDRRILIIADSTVDLSPELIKEYNIGIIPLGVNVGGKHYLDGVDMDPDGIYAHYEKTGELPKTTAANVADFEDFFEKNLTEGSSAVLFTISDEMSSTYANALIAAERFEEVHVVNTRNLSTGGGLLVLHGAEMVKAGKSAKEIAEECRALTGNVDASFIVDDLEFLHKGGRCSALAAFGANLLQLKPCIYVKDGKMGVGKKYRGKFGAVLPKYVEDRIGDGSDVECDHVFVTHAGCEDEVWQAVRDKVKELLPDSVVHITRAGCTISSHCGRNTLGVLFIRKKTVSD